jgi:hypothetical protein
MANHVTYEKCSPGDALAITPRAVYDIGIARSGWLRSTVSPLAILKDWSQHVRDFEDAVPSTGLAFQLGSARVNDGTAVVTVRTGPNVGYETVGELARRLEDVSPYTVVRLVRRSALQVPGFNDGGPATVTTTSETVADATAKAEAARPTVFSAVSRTINNAAVIALVVAGVVAVVVLGKKGGR